MEGNDKTQQKTERKASATKRKLVRGNEAVNQPRSIPRLFFWAPRDIAGNNRATINEFVWKTIETLN